ncbi:respiratory chain complex I subunit 1 family protein [Thermoanaerobacter wiegelii]|uniref:Respiratory-chain NADH dehydrogenase subunit 1 n=1 Tax=Thermoanaerobacter wiegelii Rt8.B1 TaxID=697303 RepID=G2MUN3_9THEO|nr:complex I subunit 1 family protein [Thermoanaerobacter wiegelii]AEM77556.1 respiratory-chain NADH dehydrogenase subunit 1 [Thermoanaerobacter wiegelii Rt8.B1]
MIAAIRVFGYSLFAIFIGLLFMGIGRKIIARIQLRLGPPFYQAFLDVGKLFARKSITHNFVMDLGMIMSLAGLLSTMLFVPVAGHMAIKTSSNLILIIYLMAIGHLGMAMAASASGNPNATIGVSRALTMMLGYEIPFFTVMLGLIIFNGTSSLELIAQSQAGGILNWNMVKFPLGFLAAEIALQAIMGEKPFDAMVAPAEIASGPMVELGGKYLGLAFLTHAVSIFVETGIMVNLFMGGASNVFTFVLKQFEIYLITVLIEAVFPRFRIEQAVKFLWTVPMSIAVVQLAIILL